MSAQTPKAFFLSATLHGVVVALILFFTWQAARKVEVPTPVFELVAGEGDNYLAREAPALGTPGGIKLDVSAPPAPEPEPARVEPAPAPPEPAAITPAPPAPVETPKKAPEKAPTKDVPPDFAKQITRKVIVGESKAKQQIARERKAEAKRLAEEKKKQQQMSKAEFDAQNKNKTKSNTASTSKSNSGKTVKVDTAGIRKGVLGGSTSNTTGGAGGKALVANYDDELGAYFALFKQRLRANFNPPPGLSDTLKAEIEFRSGATGTITNARIVDSSGSDEFDRAVLEALRRVTLPARPDKKSETVTFTFSMREEDSG